MIKITEKEKQLYLENYVKYYKSSVVISTKTNPDYVIIQNDLIGTTTHIPYHSFKEMLKKLETED